MLTKLEKSLLKLNLMKNLLAIAFLLTVLSCSKDKVEETPTTDYELYKQTKLDFNNDGTVDLNVSIRNFGTADVPQSSGANYFTVSSADSNLTFLSKSVNLDDYLYEENETISINASSYLSFKYFYSTLYRRTIQKGKYFSDWMIDQKYSTKKIIVFQNNKGQTTKYGWIKLNFNISTKKMTIDDYFETSTSSFKTGKK
jgi:hypothetical protein